MFITSFLCERDVCLLRLSRKSLGASINCLCSGGSSQNKGVYRTTPSTQSLLKPRRIKTLKNLILTPLKPECLTGNFPGQ